MFDKVIGLFCWLLCLFCDCCEGHEECPDGICDPIRTEVSKLEQNRLEASAVKPRSVNIDWSRIKFVVDAAVALIQELRKLVK